MGGPVRTLVAWCPDWPVVAMGRGLDQPVAVVAANRVVAASPAARAVGVARGQRRRAAQGACADLEVLARDEAAEARSFEPVLASLDDLTPLIEVVRPGTCAFVMKGPSRYFGGDQAVVEGVMRRMTEVVDGRTDVRVGVADGPFAAGLAARLADPIRLVDQGSAAGFLAPLPVTVLERPDLCDVLVRLGVTTLGAFAALPSSSVIGRFGSSGMAAHRLASGLDPHPPEARPLRPDWSVSTEIDPPANRVDRVAFCARGLADQLHSRLAGEGLACVRVAIEAETEHGETLLRLWRHEGALSAGAIADRVRWQLDGWLNGSAVTRPSAGISRLALVPDEVIPGHGRQLGFWGGETEADERAARVAARLQGQLGIDSVLVPELRGGRDTDQQIVLVSAATVELRGRSIEPEVHDSAPWPGALPCPSPANVLATPISVELLDSAGVKVGVSGRGAVSAPPTRLVRAGRPFEIKGWAGPWPVEERWWDPESHRRRARVQVLTTDGVASLVALVGGQWWITAVWD